MRAGGKHRREVRRAWPATKRPSWSSIALFAAGGAAVLLVFVIGTLGGRNTGYDPSPPAAAATAATPSLSPTRPGRAASHPDSRTRSPSSTDDYLRLRTATWMGGSAPVPSLGTAAVLSVRPEATEVKKAATGRDGQGKDLNAHRQNAGRGKKPLEPAQNSRRHSAVSAPPQSTGHDPKAGKSEPSADKSSRSRPAKRSGDSR